MNENIRERWTRCYNYIIVITYNVTYIYIYIYIYIYTYAKGFALQYFQYKIVQLIICILILLFDFSLVHGMVCRD